MFTQANFDKWVEFGVIPYLDLKLIARIEGKKITQKKLGELIFTDDEADATERIRKSTKLKAELLIKNKIHKALSAQLTTQKVTEAKKIIK